MIAVVHGREILQQETPIHDSLSSIRSISSFMYPCIRRFKQTRSLPLLISALSMEDIRNSKPVLRKLNLDLRIYAPVRPTLRVHSAAYLCVGANDITWPPDSPIRPRRYDRNRSVAVSSSYCAMFWRVPASSGTAHCQQSIHEYLVGS